MARYDELVISVASPNCHDTCEPPGPIRGQRGTCKKYHGPLHAFHTHIKPLPGHTPVNDYGVGEMLSLSEMDVC